jgi:hypothetical protein
MLLVIWFGLGVFAGLFWPNSLPDPIKLNFFGLSVKPVFFMSNPTQPNGEWVGLCWMNGSLDITY